MYMRIKGSMAATHAIGTCLPVGVGKGPRNAGAMPYSVRTGWLPRHWSGMEGDLAWCVDGLLSEAGGAQWPLATDPCAFLKPLHSIGGGAHWPLTTECL